MKFFDRIRMLLGFPLFLCSFILYRTTRVTIRKGMTEKMRRRMQHNKTISWKGFSEILKLPMALPYSMVNGPRWNCHAVIGAVGPFNVENQVKIKTSIADASTSQWTIVVYNSGFETETFISNKTVGECTSEETIQLKPGIYRLVLRYYNCNDEIAFPEVEIDDRTTIEKRIINNEPQEYSRYLDRIRNHQNLFYFMLHYYVYYLLKWRRWFSPSFVDAEFLPVGNPETEFLYGIAKKGEKIIKEFDPNVLADALVYIVFSNRCSFPVYWEEVKDPAYVSKPVPCNGYYLIRIVKN